MASDAPKGESLAWQKLGDKYYTREVHYESAWDAEQVDLRKLDAFAAPFAGPVGSLRSSAHTVVFILCIIASLFV